MLCMFTGKRTAIWLVMLATLALPASAADFSLLAFRSDDNPVVVTYYLTNNSFSLNAVDFTLFWNPLDPIDDKTKAKAKFDPVLGYLQPYPSGWWPGGGDNPMYATLNPSKAVKPGETLGVFKAKYKESTGSSESKKDKEYNESVVPEWFTVGYYSGSDYHVSTPFYYTNETPENVTPEPGSLMTIAAGMIACVFGRRKSLISRTPPKIAV